ncbi:1-deoxy-D-xylulose-5-phosphate synthase [Rubritalea tangerina]|uniref:1-deoxy-D-xylulose-5-phosphate synthase n=1 Tax=Rubritalea tangerina TaxID=430798 RepID=A0ABW4Z7Q9_9BACT
MSESRRTIAIEEACSDISESGSSELLPTKESPFTRIMYIECKAGELTGEARIGRVRFNRTHKTLYYGELKFQSLKGRGVKSNYCEVNTGEDYWISGPKKDGSDRLYSERLPIHIDDDVRVEYWTDIRNRTDLIENQFA